MFFLIGMSFIVGYFYLTKDLTFKIDKFSNEEISILVENESLIKRGNLLIPVTLITLHPIFYGI